MQDTLLNTWIFCVPIRYLFNSLPRACSAFDRGFGSFEGGIYTRFIDNLHIFRGKLRGGVNQKASAVFRRYINTIDRVYYLFFHDKSNFAVWLTRPHKFHLYIYILNMQINSFPFFPNSIFYYINQIQDSSRVRVEFSLSDCFPSSNFLDALERTSSSKLKFKSLLRLFPCSVRYSVPSRKRFQ